MKVTVVTGTGGSSTLSVTRAVNGTAETAHSKGGPTSAILKVPAGNPPITVAMTPGTYIMAGGGFQVCGNVTLNAPHVLIYSTNDPFVPNATYGKVGQVEINTTGTVTLGPQTVNQDPLYSGFTIWEDRNLAVDPVNWGTPTAFGNAQKLSAGISPFDEVFDVTGTSPTVYPGNVIQIENELMLVTAVTNHVGSTTLTVERGYSGTAQVMHSAVTPVLSAKYDNSKCGQKAGTDADFDIAFLSAGSSGVNGALGGVSGTIYAAGPRADFENDLLGNANLAVISSCVFIHSGAVPTGSPPSNFVFQPGPSGPAGVSEGLSN
jgi:hypothetical protein